MKNKIYIMITLMIILFLGLTSSTSYANEEDKNLILENETKVSNGYERNIQTYANTASVNDFTYKIENNEATITGYVGSVSSMVIPTKIENYKVTRIGNGAFYQNKVITSATIPETITQISEGAFADCVNLTKITIGNNVQNIGAYAFQNTKITQINIPATVTFISNLAFFKCPNLTNVNISSNNNTYFFENGAILNKNKTEIYMYLFARKEKTYTVPATVTKICQESFINDYLEKIIIPKATTQIECNYFCFTTPALKTIEVNRDNTKYTSVNGILYSKDKKTIYAYPAGKKESSFSIPVGTENINSCAFYNTQYLKTIIIPNTVKYIDTTGFRYSEGLEEITIPESVTEFGAGLFGDCPNLRKVTINCNTKLLSYLTFDECPNLEEVIINGNIETIIKGAFYKCPKLTKVTLPNSLITIKSQAFFYCTGLKQITIPKNVDLIETRAFYDYTEPNYTANTKLDISKTKLKKQSDGSYMAYYNYTVKGLRDYEKAYQVLDIVNQYRTLYGLDPLVMNKDLLEVAMKRATEVVTLFEHVRPNGLEITTLINIPYNYFGENIAKGQQTAEQVMNSWMNSDGHRSNILSYNYESIGIGCYKDDNGRYQWVQVFTDSKSTQCAKPANKSTIETYPVRYSILPFEDVKKGDWYYDSVKYNLINRYIVGINSSRFNPQAKLSRAMLVTILWRMAGEPKISGGKNFPDVHSKEYYYNAVKWASNKGIVNGYNNGTFGPNDNITREQLAVIIRNYAKYANKNINQRADISKYTDAYKITGYARPAVEWAVANGIISGKFNGTKIDPQGTASRAETAAMIYNYCTRIK